MVTLEPMTEAEFQSFVEPAIAEYAQGHVTDGQWAEEEALEKSRKEFGSGSLEQDGSLGSGAMEEEEQARLMHQHRLGKGERHAHKTGQRLS